MVKKQKYKVIRDTREKNGYLFKEIDNCTGMVVKKLDTGDYTIQGLEDKICIERKGCIEEMALNLGKNRGTFLREIKRMKSYDHKFLVLEFSLEDLINFPDFSRIPIELQQSIKISGKFMLKSLMEFQLNEGIQVVFCGDRNTSFLYISKLLKRLSEKYNIKE